MIKRTTLWKWPSIMILGLEGSDIIELWTVYTDSSSKSLHLFTWPSFTSKKKSNNILLSRIENSEILFYSPMRSCISSPMADEKTTGRSKDSKTSLDSLFFSKYFTGQFKTLSKCHRTDFTDKLIQDVLSNL